MDFNKTSGNISKPTETTRQEAATTLPGSRQTVRGREIVLGALAALDKPQGTAVRSGSYNFVRSHRTDMTLEAMRNFKKNQSPDEQQQGIEKFRDTINNMCGHSLIERDRAQTRIETAIKKGGKPQQEDIRLQKRYNADLEIAQRAAHILSEGTPKEREHLNSLIDDHRTSSDNSPFISGTNLLDANQLVYIKSNLRKGEVAMITYSKINEPPLIPTNNPAEAEVLAPIYLNFDDIEAACFILPLKYGESDQPRDHSDVDPISSSNAFRKNKMLTVQMDRSTEVPTAIILRDNDAKAHYDQLNRNPNGTE